MINLALYIGLLEETITGLEQVCVGVGWGRIEGYNGWMQ